MSMNPNPTKNLDVLSKNSAMFASSCIVPSPFTLSIRSQTLASAQTPHFHCHFSPKPISSSLRQPPPPISSTSGDAAPSVIHFEEIVEKDWSFLESDLTAASDDDRIDKSRRIISAGDVRSDSRVLISMGTPRFVDKVVEWAPSELLLVIHESLFTLAMIKESHDRVRCWQGGIEAVPEKFKQFDAVFLCYLPGMAVSIEQVLAWLAPRCSAGGKVVISFDQGRNIIEQHRAQYPDMVTSNLPDRTALEKAATERSFQLTEFVDEPTFYLAVLRYH